MVKQVGGDHYEAEYGHWDWASETNLGYLEGCASKYLVRWPKKGGVLDLEKSVTYIEKLTLKFGEGWVKPAGERPERNQDLLEQFLSSAQVPDTEADIIRAIDNWRFAWDLRAVIIPRIQRLIASAEL